MSFLASTTLAILCIIYAWFQNAIPSFADHPLDLYVKKFLCRSILRRDFRDTPARAEVVDAIEAFLLALSDQQLLTSLAILSAAYLKADITEYTFRVASALASLASAVHLATLLVLKR